MRDGDFIPTRMEAQQDAVSLIFHAKTKSNPKNKVGLLTLSEYESSSEKSFGFNKFYFSGRIVTQLTSDVGKVFSKLPLLPMQGKIDFCKGIKIANVK